MQKRERSPVAAVNNEKKNALFPATLLQKLHVSLSGKELRVLRVVDPLHLDVEIVPTDDADEPTASMEITSFRLQLAGLSFRKMASKAKPAAGKRVTKPCVNCGKPPKAEAVKKQPASANAMAVDVPTSDKTGMQMLEDVLESNTFRVKTVYGMQAIGKNSALVCVVVDEDGAPLVDSLLGLGVSCDGEWKAVCL
jgi:hypothetical protein